MASYSSSPPQLHLARNNFHHRTEPCRLAITCTSSIQAPIFVLPSTFPSLCSSRRASHNQRFTSPHRQCQHTTIWRSTSVLTSLCSQQHQCRLSLWQYTSVCCNPFPFSIRSCTGEPRVPHSSPISFGEPPSSSAFSVNSTVELSMAMSFSYPLPLSITLSK